MKKYIGLSLLALFTWVALAAQVQQKLPRITVKKNQFVNDKGEVVVFRGFNTSDPAKLSRSGHWTRQYFEEAKAWGANCLRFPVHPSAWRELGEANYLKLLDQGIEWAESLGMYVIIDWHSIGNLRMGLFQNQGYYTTLQETNNFWRTMAERYAGRSSVPFFELFNEPTDMGGRLGSITWQQWKEINADLIRLIRSWDPDKIVLVAGFDWAYDLTPVRSEPLPFENIAYVSHPYPMKRQKPWEPQWEKDWGFVADTYPVFATEIGFCYPTDKGAHVPVMADEEYGRRIVEYCASKGISWMVWVFDPDWAPMMFSDWNYTPTHQGAFFKSVLTK